MHGIVSMLAWVTVFVLVGLTLYWLARNGGKRG